MVIKWNDFSVLSTGWSFKQIRIFDYIYERKVIFHFNNLFSERAIDPSVRLIVLHDNRLFISRMHYLWKRFINVIFVRQYEQINRISNRRFTGNRTTFELTTVPYPMPISELFVTKTLDFWRNGKYRYGTKLNIDKTKNLQGNL